MAIVAAVLAVLGGGAALLRAESLRAAVAEAELAAEAERAAAAELEREAAEERVRDRERAVLLMELQQIRLGAHEHGWSKKVEEKARRIAAIRRDATLRDQYAASFAGLDAYLIKEFKFDASSVAFSKDGKRLLMGGYTDSEGVAREPARVWDGGLEEPRKSTQLGSGPVAFREADGAALQLVPDPKDWFTLRLWNLEKQGLVRELKLAEKPSPPDWHHRNSLALALSPDGSQVAASTANRLDGKGTLVVWDVSPGKPSRTVEKGFSALAFSPDASLLAAGDREGTVTVWSRGQQKERTILHVGRTAILGLAFTRDTRHRTASAVEDGWLLAVAEAGSTVTVWDLEKKQPRATCRGSSWNVNAVAFGPDGTLLASAGRGTIKFWDAATDRLLLTIRPDQRNWLTGLALSPDGKRMVASSKTVFGKDRGGVDVWELQHGRGIQTLLGLTNRVAQVRFSPDDRLVAALDDDWKVGIWDLSTGRLLQVLDAPPG